MPVSIVVIDASEEYRLIVRGLLRSVHDVTTFVGDAANGAEGLVLVRRERPDIVITDLVMPGLDGVELTRRIRLELPKTKIILMSSHIEDAYRLMASDSGADAFVNKQMITRTLLPAIGDVVRREAEALDKEAKKLLGLSPARVKK
ncbi:MAG: response regulator transcription factor [Candidatus Rokuibacteriota bacterium]